MEYIRKKFKNPELRNKRISDKLKTLYKEGKLKSSVKGKKHTNISLLKIKEQAIKNWNNPEYRKKIRLMDFRERKKNVTS